MQAIGIDRGPTHRGRDNVTEWIRHTMARNVRTKQQNIVTHLPGVRAAAKTSKTPKE